jgi:hypothetical protein
MVVNLTKERETELLNAHHLRCSEIEAEHKRLDQERQQSKADREATYQEYVQKQNKPHKLRNPQICRVCNQLINAKEYAISQSVKVGFGFTEGFHRVTVYRHEGCKQ